jgi:signal transduction histidine kinase
LDPSPSPIKSEERLAGGIAHDFNNIMNGMLGYAEMLVRGSPEGSPHRRYAENVISAASRANDLVQRVLSDSRGRCVPVELNPIVAEALELARGCRAEGIEFELQPPAAPLFVLGDATQLHRIVLNLCANAIHAMGRRGRLCVSLGAVEVASERRFTHTTLAPGAYAVLRVEDTGHGMDPETLARIFQPFFTTKEAGEGTGLGLSLVYGIVADSRGAIDVRSTRGRGSIFSIYLPRVDS